MHTWFIVVLGTLDLARGIPNSTATSGQPARHTRLYKLRGYKRTYFEQMARTKQK